MATGTVMRFNGIKQYGFIQPDDASPGVFAHTPAASRRAL